MIALYILAYLWVGFIAVVSPVGHEVCTGEKGDIPPLFLLLLWPVLVPMFLIHLGCRYFNNKLKDLLK